ncbi:hypothetical protein FA15DRAFT_661884 [Coprinopsis marcescibilis]|uniref:Uncharacterized protein n=1 Tax=Coprinopsis marcescibilis TaxID=230819 RepID=A0A5C3KA44_COPMA|nr:hypothetical protein FA15DRAFT_661884 [Coprinopsis marcescibilis]
MFGVRGRTRSPSNSSCSSTPSNCSFGSQRSTESSPRTSLDEPCAQNSHVQKGESSSEDSRKHGQSQCRSFGSTSSSSTVRPRQPTEVLLDNDEAHFNRGIIELQNAMLDKHIAKRRLLHALLQFELANKRLESMTNFHDLVYRDCINLPPAIVLRERSAEDWEALLLYREGLFHGLWVTVGNLITCRRIA